MEAELNYIYVQEVMNSKGKTPIEKSPGREIYSKEFELKRENAIDKEGFILDFAVKANRFPQNYCDDNREDTMFLLLHINYTHLASIYIYILYIFYSSEVWKKPKYNFLRNRCLVSFIYIW